MERIKKRYRYNMWANGVVIDALVGIGLPPEKAIAWMSHVVAGERLWWSRIRGKSSPFAVWPHWSIDECEHYNADMGRMWSDFLDSESVDGLTRVIAYTNTASNSFMSTVEEILEHVLLHSQYHRGQINAELRRAGHDPPYTDYIHAVRNELVR